MKRLLIISGAVILAAAAGLAALRYQTAGKKTLLFDVPSQNNEYILKMYMVGEPDFPFGSVTCEAALFKDSQRIGSESFVMPNDGKIPDESSFEIFWSDSSVTVLAHPEEADDQKITLQFE